jgi:hypothetical protein
MSSGSMVSHELKSLCSDIEGTQILLNKDFKEN